MIKFKERLRQLFLVYPELSNRIQLREDIDKLINESFDRLSVTETLYDHELQRIPPGDLDTIISRKLAIVASQKLQERVKFRRDPDRIAHQYCLDIWVYTGEDK